MGNGQNGSLDKQMLIQVVTQSAALMYHQTAILNAFLSGKLTAADWSNEFLGLKGR